jgi:hypothetical protein
MHDPRAGFLWRASARGCERCGGYVHPLPLHASPTLCVDCRETFVRDSVARGVRELERFLAAHAGEDDRRERDPQR